MFQVASCCFFQISKLGFIIIFFSSIAAILSISYDFPTSEDHYIDENYYAYDNSYESKAICSLCGCKSYGNTIYGSADYNDPAQFEGLMCHNCLFPCTRGLKSPVWFYSMGKVHIIYSTSMIVKSDKTVTMRGVKDIGLVGKMEKGKEWEYRGSCETAEANQLYIGYLIKILYNKASKISLALHMDTLFPNLDDSQKQQLFPDFNKNARETISHASLMDGFSRTENYIVRYALKPRLTTFTMPENGQVTDAFDQYVNQILTQKPLFRMNNNNRIGGSNNIMIQVDILCRIKTLPARSLYPNMLNKVRYVLKRYALNSETKRDL